MCLKRRNEFRTNNSKKGKGHPSYIYKKEGDEFYFIGITHSDITHGAKNIKLDRNPNPDDNRISYFRHFATKDKVTKFGKKKKGWRLSFKEWLKARKIKKNFRE